MDRPTHALPRDLGVGAGVGAFSGLLGVGGGLLLVPYLTLVRGLGQKRAQATSLVMVALAAAAGTARYAWGDSVAWREAGVVTIGGLAGAWLGAHVVQRSPDHRLQAAFGALLVLVGFRLLWPSPDAAALPTELPELTPALIAGYALAGVGMGLLSALFGIGGGILLIPVLVGLFSFTQQLAAGTSLAVMVPIALMGAVRLTGPGLTDWGQGSRFGVGAMAGALVGASLALAVSSTVLQWVFAVVMIVIGARVVALGAFRRPTSAPEPGSEPGA